MTTRQTPVNALTVDVEDYFQVSAFENVISRATWDSMTVRVGDNTHRLLDLFLEQDVKCTFFYSRVGGQKVPGYRKAYGCRRP